MTATSASFVSIARSLLRNDEFLGGGIPGNEDYYKREYGVTEEQLAVLEGRLYQALHPNDSFCAVDGARQAQPARETVVSCAGHPDIPVALICQNQEVVDSTGFWNARDSYWVGSVWGDPTGKYFASNEGVWCEVAEDCSRPSAWGVVRWVL